MKKVFSLLLALMLVFSLAVPAYAAQNAITVRYDKARPLSFAVVSAYHNTDLFNGFKNVMPGDTLVEKITITNKVWNHDYIRLWLEAVPHDASNPLEYSESFEQIDGKDQGPDYTGRDETIATMEDFLNKLTMVIRDDNGHVIFSGSPVDGPDKKYLGQINKNKSMDLTVELYVPIELDNKYANRVGEVDWVFTVEAFTYSGETPKTGDFILRMALPVMVVSGAMLLFLLFWKKKRQKE